MFIKGKKILISLILVGCLTFIPVYAQTTEELTLQLNSLIHQLIALLMEQIKVLQIQLAELQTQQANTTAAINQIIPIVIPPTPPIGSPSIPPYNPPPTWTTPAEPIVTPSTTEPIMGVSTSSASNFSYSKDTISRNWSLTIASFVISTPTNPNPHNNCAIVKSLAFIKNDPTLEVKNLQVLLGYRRFGNIEIEVPDNQIIIFRSDEGQGICSEDVFELKGGLSVDAPEGIHITPFELNNGSAFISTTTILWPNPVKGQDITISQ